MVILLAVEISGFIRISTGWMHLWTCDCELGSADVDQPSFLCSLFWISTSVDGSQIHQAPIVDSPRVQVNTRREQVYRGPTRQGGQGRWRQERFHQTGSRRPCVEVLPRRRCPPSQKIKKDHCRCLPPIFHNPRHRSHPPRWPIPWQACCLPQAT